MQTQLQTKKRAPKAAVADLSTSSVGTKLLFRVLHDLPKPTATPTSTCSAELGLHRGLEHMSKTECVPIKKAIFKVEKPQSKSEERSGRGTGGRVAGSEGLKHVLSRAERGLKVRAYLQKRMKTRVSLKPSANFKLREKQFSVSKVETAESSQDPAHDVGTAPTNSQN